MSNAAALPLFRRAAREIVSLTPSPPNEGITELDFEIQRLQEILQEHVARCGPKIVRTEGVGDYWFVLSKFATDVIVEPLPAAGESDFNEKSRFRSADGNAVFPT